MKHLHVGALVAVAALVATAPLVFAGGTPHSTGGAALPPPVGLHLSRNRDAEPGIAVDGGGTLWIAGDVNPNETTDPRSSGIVLTGADVWKSTNGGRSYVYAGSPFSTAERNNPGAAGEDTDMAAAPVKDSSGHYRAYVASLWLGATSVATTTDGGASWSVNPLGGVPAQDRPFIAASGPCTVYLLYHQLPSFTPFVNTYDLCTLSNNNAGAVIPAVSQAQVLADQASGNVFNKLVVDNSPYSQYKGSVYVPLQICSSGGNPKTLVTDTATSCAAEKMVLAVSRDGARTFAEYPIASSTTAGTPVWGATVATDATGRVYYTWADKSAAWVSVSSDGGAHWSRAIRVSTGPAHTAVYPTVAAGAPGQVAVAWYGTTLYSAKGSDDRAVMGPPGVPGGAVWRVWMAESRDGGRTWREDEMTGPIHLGQVCTGGSSCLGNGDRNLYDDFGVVLLHGSNLAAIAYSADLPGGKSTDTFTGYVTERCRLGSAACSARL